MIKTLNKNKRTINVLILVSLLVTLAYFINNARIQNNNYFKINNNLQNLILYNKDFNLYLRNSFKYNNFDIIQKKIDLSKNNLDQLRHNTILLSIKNKKLQEQFTELQKNLTDKYKLINRTKSYRAILNKSYLIVQKIKSNGIDNSFTELYATVMTIDKNPAIDIQKELQFIKKIENHYLNKNDIFFLKHAKTIFTYHLKLNDLNNKLLGLAIEQELKNFDKLYSEYASSTLQTANLAVIILFLLLICSILFYLVYDYKLVKSEKELSRFKKTVQDSDNIVMITDENMLIKYVNDAFTTTTGYTKEEAIGKNPRFLNSGRHTKEFYKALIETIYSGKKWRGQFVNLSKQKKLSFESATISPVLDEDGKIIEFIAIKSDITKETLGQEQLLKKEKLLLQQSKMAALGEMLQNIAHQWRQPLSLISTAATGLLVKKELNLQTSQEEDIKTLNTINDTTQYLSDTINAFRDFFQQNKTKVEFKVKDIYQKTLNIIQVKLDTLDIKLIENIDDVTITNFDNELIQVLMNILNNSKDALESSKIKEKLVFVDIYSTENHLIIKIKDNAGGIKEEILGKVFEPYFTTKHKSQGTGIGLYMCQEIVKMHMDGEVTVKNKSFTYENEAYLGAQFKIKIPL